MALIDNGDEVVGEIIEQTERSRAWTTPIEITRIVLNARAIAQFLHHLKVVVHSVFQALCFKVFTNLAEILGLLKHVVLNLRHGGVEFGLRGHEDVGGEDGQFRKILHPSARHGIEHLQAVDFVIPKHNAVSIVGIGGKHIHGLPFHPELALRELNLVTHIQSTHQGFCHIVAADFHATLQIDDVLAKIIWVAYTIET